MNWVGAGLDYNMITQPNPRRGIMVTFNMIASMARADATICICFVDGAVADRLVVLDCLEKKIRVWVCWNVHSREVKGKSRCIEEASGRDALFFRELKSAILKLQDLWSSDVGTNLHRPDRGGGRRSFLVSKEFVDPLVT